MFGVIWNVEDCKSSSCCPVESLGHSLLPSLDNKPREWQASTKWEQKLNEFIWSFDDGNPRFRHQVRTSPSRCQGWLGY